MENQVNQEQEAGLKVIKDIHFSNLFQSIINENGKQYYYATRRVFLDYGETDYRKAIERSLNDNFLTLRKNQAEIVCIKNDYIDFGGYFEYIQ